MFDPKAGVLHTLELRDVPPPRVSPDDAPAAPDPAASPDDVAIPKGATLVTSVQALASTSGMVSVQIDLPPGYHLTRGANSRFEASAGGPSAAGEDPSVWRSD